MGLILCHRVKDVARRAIRMFVTCYCTLQAGLILERILHCEFTKLFAPYPARRSWPLGQSPEARTELGSL